MHKARFLSKTGMEPGKSCPGATPSPAGWTWANPLPQGFHLRSVWGSGPADIRAVGEGGTILHHARGKPFGDTQVGQTVAPAFPPNRFSSHSSPCPAQEIR